MDGWVDKGREEVAGPGGRLSQLLQSVLGLDVDFGSCPAGHGLWYRSRGVHGASRNWCFVPWARYSAAVATRTKVMNAMLTIT